MARLQLPVLELLMDFVARCCGASGGIVALEAEARECFARSQTQRCNCRAALQLRGMRCAAAAQSGRAAMWRERSHGYVQQLEHLLGGIADLDEEMAVIPRVRKLVYLRRLDQELLARLMARRPSLLPWALREQDSIRAVLDEEESEAEDEQ